jgi:dihydroorotate dehydrogenase (NAD+) catalytic subunit
VDWGHGLINAVGLPNPGVEEEAELLASTKARLDPLGVALIASVFADTPQGFAAVARRIAQARPDLIEINVSCPNVTSECGEPYAATPEGVTAVTAAVRDATNLPIIVKLSPAVAQIARIAVACQAAGADAICAVNTMPGMVIDAESGRPVLANFEGGLSGPALKPVAIRAVYTIAREVDIPVIGTGGVLTGTDAVEMLMAGAQAVGVGSALYYRGPEAFASIRSEMETWLSEHGQRDLVSVRGAALRPARRRREPTPPPIPGGGYTLEEARSEGGLG